MASGSTGSVIATSGTLVLVVGPSGVGKDSILRYAAQRLNHDQKFQFPRRVITRLCNPAAEDHDSLTADEFEAVSSSGGFAISWEAHGLKYGIRGSAIAELDRGCIVSINVSRTIVDEAAKRYSRLAVINIMADPEIRAKRIVERGRESLLDAKARQTRRVEWNTASIPSYDIVNNDLLDVAGEAFCSLLRQFKA